MKRSRPLGMVWRLLEGFALAAVSGWALAQDQPTTIIWREVTPGHWQWFSSSASSH